MDWIIIIHAFLFLVFWLTNLSFQQAVNEFLSDATGLRMNYLLIFLIFSAIAGLLSAFRLWSSNARKGGPTRLVRFGGWLYLLFFYGSFIILFLKNPVQIARLEQLLQYFRIFVDAAVLLLAAWGLRNWIRRQAKLRTKLFSGGLLMLLWLVPVFLTPGSILRGSMPEKPLLVAHRGAASLAPENTLAAMRLAADLGINGLETDITISRDGILFLMHDPTLKRTTNVAQVFPGREKGSADSFTWDELVRLDAGSWFVGREDYPGEPIPTLAQLLQIVQERHLTFIYDLRLPPAGHPFTDLAFDLCLAEIKASGAEARTWVLVSPEDLLKVRAALPQAIPSSGIEYRRAPTPQELVAAGYLLVNSEFGLSNHMIQAYQHSGLWVNLWTVDEPWQYSRLWMAGADSLTSNNVQLLAGMSRPVMAMAYPDYLGVWGLVGILAVALARSR